MTQDLVGPSWVQMPGFSVILQGSKRVWDRGTLVPGEVRLVPSSHS